MSTFDVFEDEETKILEIIELYNKRRRQSMNPSPYALFFLHKGAEILIQINKETGLKPEPEKSMKRIQYEWQKISKLERNIYLNASNRLGYKPRKPNTDELINRMKSKTRIGLIEKTLKNYGFM